MNSRHFLSIIWKFLFFYWSGKLCAILFRFSLVSGAADIPDCEEVRKLVQCLREVRHQKTIDGLRTIDGDPLKVKVSCRRLFLNVA